MSLLQGIWLTVVDVFLLCMAYAAWAEFLESRDPVDSRLAFAFSAFAVLSIPLFVA